jgi:perosamine synthetase
MSLKYPWRRNLVVPNNVYVAAWNPFLLEGFDLHPQDANLDTWNMELDYKDHRTNIILAVHNLGNIINVPKLKRQHPDTPIIEDNCEGFGGSYEGQPTGTAAECFSVSFYGNKNITSGEGGAFVTYDPDIFEYAFRFHGQGQSRKKFIHHFAGYNYRMTNVEAAILLGQLDLLDEILEKKDAVFSHYNSHFQRAGYAYPQVEQVNTKHANWMYGVRIEGNKNYMDFEKFMSDNGIETRPMFYPMSYHKHLHPKTSHRISQNTEEVAKQLSREVVLLPSYPELTMLQQDYIMEKVDEYVEKSGIV